MNVGLFIVGAPKAGTTSLYYYLNDHPEILMSKVKEPDYFSHTELLSQKMYYKSSSVQTIEKYEELFDKYHEEKILGEASVSYLFYPSVSLKIREYNPEAKIIIMLRNPVERAYSHYLMDYRLGILNITFKEAISDPNSLYHQQYIQLGSYYNQVKNYLSTFGKERVLFIKYADFKHKTDAVLEEVYEFLGVDNTFKGTTDIIHNPFAMSNNKFVRKFYSLTWLRKFIVFILPKKIISFLKSKFFSITKKPSIDNSTRDELMNYYLSDIENLEELTQLDFSVWKKLD